MFFVGQKVVCVKDASHYATKGEPKVNIGEIFTIRAIIQYKSGPGFWFVEIKNPPILTEDGVMERGYATWRFRPLVEKKPDISIFERILDDVNAGKIDEIVGS